MLGKEQNLRSYRQGWTRIDAKTFPPKVGGKELKVAHGVRVEWVGVGQEQDTGDLC